jgi:hypothetical protein
VWTERLSDHVSAPVDFLKLNIEGDELPVLLDAEASGTLRICERSSSSTTTGPLASSSWRRSWLFSGGSGSVIGRATGTVPQPARGVGREWGPSSCLVCARRIDASLSATDADLTAEEDLSRLLTACGRPRRVECLREVVEERAQRDRNLLSFPVRS